MQTESLRNVSVLLLQKHFKASMLTSCPRKKTQTRTKDKFGWVVVSGKRKILGPFWPNYILFIKKKQIKNDFKKKAAWWNKLLTAKVNSFATEENAV